MVSSITKIYKLSPSILTNLNSFYPFECVDRTSETILNVYKFQLYDLALRGIIKLNSNAHLIDS